MRGDKGRVDREREGDEAHLGKAARRVGEDHGLDAVAGLQLRQDPLDVRLDRGLLDHELAGDLAVRETAPDEREHDRRSIYLIAKRNLRLPFAQVFDQPDLQTSCPRRESSTHALQALELLNGQTANRLAEAFAQRLAREAGSDPTRQVELAYQLAAGRGPTNKETRLAVAFLETQPLTEFALAMFNLSAFLYVD